MPEHTNRQEISVDRQALLRQIDQTLEEAGIYVATEVRGNTLYLSGEVDSDENRQAALDVATAVAEPAGLAIDDDIEISPSAPDEAFADSSAQYGTAYGYMDTDENNDGRLDPEFASEPDFTGDIGTLNVEEAVEEAEPYYPNTDPVTETYNDRTEAELTGTLREEDEEASDTPRQDDDLRVAVLDALARDALTQDLQIQVVVVNAVVTLLGTVPRIEDVENAEEVAGRIEDIREVREQLHVAS